ncbi:MAG TPA: hypothetical protein DHV37_06065 [Erysipelotrichaceae bacterium]|nr:hypothetical protein [Erysipelotrichaceae bacterium]
MAMLRTKNGRNMYDMLSLLQKAIRRCHYKEAAYAANELEKSYRGALWSRMLVISAEDCYGVLTKELIRLKELDDEKNDNELIGQAIAVMCKALKSRDACYFSCNFVLDSRCPRKIVISDDVLKEYKKMYGEKECKKKKENEQMSMFDEEVEEETSPIAECIAIMHEALNHRDMDMIGYQIDRLRIEHRKILWSGFKDYAKRILESDVINEIEALEKADSFVNRNKKNGLKDEIFVSKAAMILCYEKDQEIDDVMSSEVVKIDKLIDWTPYKVKPIEECFLVNDVIPEWVFDCHTLKGKRMGKTDWDMTVDEQEALYPKKYAYFDEGSWLYTYMQDVRNGDLSEEGFMPIKKFAETHEANPVSFIPYE